MRKCTLKDCNKPYLAKGYCKNHYRLFMRYGFIPDRLRTDPNEFILYDDYSEIILYGEDCKEKARTIIDLEDVEKCRKYKWHLGTNNSVLTKVKGKMVYLHHYLVGFKGVDHINHNRLDNRKGNLRKATQQENCRNFSKQKNTSSKYKGVTWMKRNKKWQAQICIDGKKKYLGLFEFEETAAQAYNFFAKEHFGEFACLNNI